VFTMFCLQVLYIQGKLFSGISLIFFILPINFAETCGNGNMLIKRRQLNPEKKECPAPQSHTISYRLIPLTTPFLLIRHNP